MQTTIENIVKMRETQLKIELACCDIRAIVRHETSMAKVAHHGNEQVARWAAQSLASLAVIAHPELSLGGAA